MNRLFRNATNVVASLAERFSSAACYVADRQCRSGGFCFYRNEHLEEPNLSDTWHALAALRLLAADIPNSDKLDAWLDGFDPHAIHPEGLYYWSFARSFMRSTWTPDDSTVQRIAAFPLRTPATHADIMGWLKMLLRTLALQSTFASVGDASEVVMWLQQRRHGGYGTKPNLQETALTLELLAALRAPDETKETRRFVNALQSPSMGFDNALDSRYCRLGILLSGVRCCQLLGLPVRYQSVILSTALAAQYSDGAFADVPGALPTLETHHDALELLCALVPYDSRSRTGTEELPPWSR